MAWRWKPLWDTAKIPRPLTLANYYFIDLQKYWKTHTPVQLRLGFSPVRWIAILTGYFSAISDAPMEFR